MLLLTIKTADSYNNQIRCKTEENGKKTKR